MDKRLSYLDAARGIAALLVVFQHYAEKWDPFKQWSITCINFGQIGVVVFFLISGYVIPRSLHRHGSVFKFFISRFFRIFPLYWFAFAAALLIGPYSIRWTSCIAHLLMIQSFFKFQNLVGISWTLIIEIPFYVLSVLVFFIGIKRLPRLALLTSIILLLLLLLSSGKFPAYPTALILTAFAGQLIQQFEEEGLSLRTALITVVAIWSSCMLAIALRNQYKLYMDTGCLFRTWSLAYLIFIGILYFQPTSGAFLGRISYSIYLLHPLVLDFTHHPSLIGLCLNILIILTLSTITYYLIEVPGIKLGSILSTFITKPIHSASPAPNPCSQELP